MKPWQAGFLLIVLLAGCAREQRLNILLLTIDTCRADRLSCYGYEKLHTPHVDRFASEGVLFEEARTCVPITLPSHVTMMTALYPAFHGVRDNGVYRAADSLLTLAEILKEKGYATAAFMGAFPLESRFNLDQGFDHYGDFFGTREGLSKEGPGGISIFFPERPANEVNEEFFHWLDDAGSEPFFAWLHYFDPHQPHEPKPPYDAVCAGRPYDAEIAFVDECVGRLRERLEDDRLLERTIVVITSDHGEALGEHGELTHALLLYDSTLRVPLIIRCPEAMGLRSRVGTQVRTIDLAPTIMELLGMTFPAWWQGKSIVGPMRGVERPTEDHCFETFYGKLHFGWSVLLGFQSGPWKYLFGPRPELYDTVNDPEEIHDLIEIRPEVAEELKGKLFSLVSTAGGKAQSVFTDPDRQTTEMLQALGYVGSWEEMGPEQSWFDGPNPVDMMRPHELYNLGRSYVHQGMWLQAIDIFQRALDADPGNKDARIGLIDALMRSNELSAALKEAQKAVSIAPHDGTTWLVLAKLMMAQRRPAEALEAGERALDEGADPVASWMLVAECSERSGNRDEALFAYHRVLAVDPSHYGARLGAARILAVTGKIEKAESEFIEALNANPYWAPAHHNYGVLLLDMEKKQEALVHFEKAVRLSPTYVAAHHAMGILLHEEGKDRAALPHLEAVVRYAQNTARREAAQSLIAQIGGNR